MDDHIEQRAAKSLVRRGYADPRNSRRIAREVISAIIDGGDERLSVTDSDIMALDDCTYEMLLLVWSMEDADSGDHSQRLMELIESAHRILKIARSYISPSQGTDLI